MIIVPKGVAHKPYSKKEAKVLMIEPKGTVNTGDIKNELTLLNHDWIQQLELKESMAILEIAIQ